MPRQPALLSKITSIALRTLGLLALGLLVAAAGKSLLAGQSDTVVEQTLKGAAYQDVIIAADTSKPRRLPTTTAGLVSAISTSDPVKAGSQASVATVPAENGIIVSRTSNSHKAILYSRAKSGSVYRLVVTLTKAGQTAQFRCVSTGLWDTFSGC